MNFNMYKVGDTVIGVNCNDKDHSHPYFNNSMSGDVVIAKIPSSTDNRYRSDYGWNYAECQLLPKCEPIKVGDQVRILKDKDFHREGCIGLVQRMDSQDSITVIFDGQYSTYFYSRSLGDAWVKADSSTTGEITTNPKPSREIKQEQKKGGVMTKLTQLARRLLDQDVKALIEVGWVNTDLSLTGEGEQAILSWLFEQNKTDLAKEAKTILAEEKKNKKDC